MSERVSDNGNLHFWRLAIKPAALPLDRFTPAIEARLLCLRQPRRGNGHLLADRRPLVLRLGGATEISPAEHGNGRLYPRLAKLKRREGVARLVEDTPDGTVRAQSMVPARRRFIVTVADGLVELPEHMTEQPFDRQLCLSEVRMRIYFRLRQTE